MHNNVRIKQFLNLILIPLVYIIKKVGSVSPPFYLKNDLCYVCYSIVCLPLVGDRHRQAL